MKFIHDKLVHQEWAVMVNGVSTLITALSIMVVVMRLWPVRTWILVENVEIALLVIKVTESTAKNHHCVTRTTAVALLWHPVTRVVAVSLVIALLAIPVVVLDQKDANQERLHVTWVRDSRASTWSTWLSERRRIPGSLTKTVQIMAHAWFKMANQSACAIKDREISDVLDTNGTLRSPPTVPKPSAVKEIIPCKDIPVIIVKLHLILVQVIHV